MLPYFSQESPLSSNMVKLGRVSKPPKATLPLPPAPPPHWALEPREVILKFQFWKI